MSEEQTVIEYTSTGIPYETVAPGQYADDHDDSSNDSNEGAALWRGRNAASDESISAEQYQDYSGAIARQQQVNDSYYQAQQLASHVGQVTNELNTYWDDPGFQQYLNSDDDGFESVQLSPNLLRAVEQTYGIDSDTARSLAYHHKLSPDYLNYLEATLTGVVPTVQSSLPPRYEQQPAPRLEEVDEDYLDPAPEPRLEPAQMLADIRRNSFPIATNAEWDGVVNKVLDAFNSLPAQERALYDNAQGFVAIHKALVATDKRIAQERAVVRQQPPDGLASRGVKPKEQGMFNAKGQLKWSAINNLSNVQYEQNAERIDAWVKQPHLVAWQE